MNEELETEMPKRGPGRPPKVHSDETPTPSVDAVRDYNEITYIPDTSDPVTTIVDFDPSRPNSGIRFSANVPVKVKKTRTIDQLETREKTNADGVRVTNAVTVKRPVVDVLRNNPRFSIDGAPPVKQLDTLPIRYDPDWYRGYAGKWITMSRSLSDMNDRWNRETLMRQECGCSYEDILYLEPQLEYMRRRLAVDI